MFSDNTCIKLKELLELLNLSSSDSTKLYNLMQDAYRDGFDYGCIRSSEKLNPKRWNDLIQKCIKSVE